jgi:hypothetical protein
VAAAEALKDAGIHLIVVAEGRAFRPAFRSGIQRNAARVQAGRERECGATQRRDDILSAIVDASEGRSSQRAARSGRRRARPRVLDETEAYRRDPHGRPDPSRLDCRVGRRTSAPGYTLVRPVRR